MKQPKEMWNSVVFEGIEHIYPASEKEHNAINCTCSPIHLADAKTHKTIKIIHKHFDKTKEDIYDDPRLKKFLKRGTN